MRSSTNPFLDRRVRGGDERSFFRDRSSGAVGACEAPRVEVVPPGQDLTVLDLEDALTWIAVIPGLTAKSADGARAFSYPLIFLPFISSAFVLTDTMPGPVRAFAENQPVTSIVNAIRDLFSQHSVGSDIWVALAECVGLLVVAYLLAMVTYRRKIA